MKRKFQRIVAFASSAAIALSTSGVQTLVQGIGGSVKAEEIILEENWSEAETVNDTAAASSGDVAVQEVDVITSYSEPEIVVEGIEVSSNEEAEQATGISLTAETSEEAQDMLVDVRLTEEPNAAAAAEDDGYAQGEVQWMHIYAADRSAAEKGEASVRIYMTDTADGTPAEEVEVLLFKNCMETLPGTVVALPVVLEDAQNGQEDLQVSRIQEYQKNENDEYVKDSEGNLIMTADYLEFTLPAGGWAEFYAAFMYRTDAEDYSYSVSAYADVMQTSEDGTTRVLFDEYTDEDYDNELTVSWEPQEEETEAVTEAVTEITTEVETETVTEITTEVETEAATEITTEVETEAVTEITTEVETEAVTEAESEAETDVPVSSIRVTMTKELEKTEALQTEAEAAIVSEEDFEEETDAVQEANTESDETEAEAAFDDTAVSGQTFIVKVEVEDVQPDALYDSTVTIHLTDFATGLPASDVATTVCQMKEDVLTTESAAENVLYGVVQTPDGLENLTVSRIQETAEAEDGTTAVTDDYLTFDLPAGSRAEFYIGFTYATEADAYEKQLMVEVKAVQYIPVQETEAESESESETASSEMEAPDQNETVTIPTSQTTDTTIIDNLSSMAGDVNPEELSDQTAATPADTDQELLSAATLEANEELSVKTQATDEDVEEVDVLDGSQTLMMTWAARSTSVVTLYYAAPVEWTQNGYIVWANGQESKNEDKWTLTKMTETDGEYEGRRVWKVEMPYPDHDGYDQFQFLAKNSNGDQPAFVSAFSAWKKVEDIDNKLFNGTEWVDYTPFDPDNHTFFSEKTMYFENRGDTDLSGGIKAIFYEKEAAATLDQLNKVAEVEMQAVFGKANTYSVSIPTSLCSYVRFADGNGNILGDTYSNFYGQGESEAGVESFIYNETSMCSYHYTSDAEDVWPWFLFMMAGVVAVEAVLILAILLKRRHDRKKRK